MHAARMGSAAFLAPVDFHGASETLAAVDEKNPSWNPQTKNTISE